MLDFLKSALPYVMTFLGGSAVTMYGQTWTTFHFKKQQDLYDKRRTLLDDWKKKLLPYFDIGPYGYPLESYSLEINKVTLMREPSFASIEPHLSAEIVERISKLGRDSDIKEFEEVRKDFRKELARIERKWKLI